MVINDEALAIARWRTARAQATLARAAVSLLERALETSSRAAREADEHARKSEREMIAVLAGPQGGVNSFRGEGR